MWNGTFASLECLFRFVETYHLATRFGRALPDLAGPPFLFLKFGFQALIGHFLTATWKPMTGPHGRQPLGHANHFHSHLPHHPTMSSFHVTVRFATWIFFIGPQINLKMTEMSDTWQPLVLPHHHDEIMLMSA
jgi:hypothetical protein